MYTEYPYRGHDNPAIRWDYAEAISANTPVAVEINESFVSFGAEAMALKPEHKLVLAEYACGRTGGMTARRVAQLPGSKGKGYAAINETYASLGVHNGGGGATMRGREKLIAQAHRADILETNHQPLPLPEDWLQPFRDLLFALISEESIAALGEMLQIKSLRMHLDEATRRVVQQQGLGHLERGGPTLITLGAGLLPATEEELKARILSPLTTEEEVFFNTLPPVGGAPLLPFPQAKASKLQTRTDPAPIPPPVVVVPEPPPRVLPPTYEGLPTIQPTPITDEQRESAKSLVIRPSELIESFGNDTVWWRVDGQPLDAQKANLLTGRIGVIGIQNGEVEIVPAQRQATQLGIDEFSVFCARISGLSTSGTADVVGIGKRGQPSCLTAVHDKIGMHVANSEIRRRALGEHELPVTARAAFEDPQLLRTVKPPKFEGLEYEYGLLMEFGPLLIRGETRRSFLYGAAKQRESLSYPKKEALISGVDADMAHLRQALRLNTLGLTFLYLATRDYEKQIAKRIGALRHEKD
jgi:hypothetical protein